MPDVEKVIEALRCRAYDDDFPCSICAYYRPDEKPVAKCDYRGLMDDAIALLKSQRDTINQLEYNLAVTQDNLYFYTNGNN